MRAKYVFVVVVTIASLGLCYGSHLSFGADSKESTKTASSTSSAEKESDDARLAWWKKARFGMFIHWGLYAVPAGTYHGKQIGSIGEWIQNSAEIPEAEYATYAQQFNPTKFNADQWVKMAKEAGVKYIVITSKHHDGFAMFKSEASPFNIVDATPFKRDPLKELATACQKEGIKLGFYYSQAQDWNHPGGAIHASLVHDKSERKHEWWDQSQEGSFDDYLQKVAIPQVKELLTNYGPVAVLWWDTPMKMTPERAKPLHDLLKMQPAIVSNNRLGGGFEGDFQTPEQKIPPNGIPGKNWETCMTINDTWGYKSYDDKFKSTRQLLQNLIDIASKGGNYLLNVGPTAEGEIPEAEQKRLLEIGQWLKVNGEAIYGTSASPFEKQLEWGRCTQKDGKLYLSVFDWPQDGKVVVPLLNAHATANLLADPKKSLAVSSTPKGLQIELPKTAPDPIASVIVLTPDGPLKLPPVSHASDDTHPQIIVETSNEPVSSGKFDPTWQSLQQYEVPEWYRNAKFGIWAHWGPQCGPEMGDWYARDMYIQGDQQNKFHVARYGHPSEFGFKDVIHQWKAENWDPEKIVALYKRAGAQYFVALASHCDNFDLWDSKYQEWNSVAVGPHKNIIAEWAKAARDNGLRFGVSMHAAHAWTWMESAQGSDKEGPLAGVPYDGRLTMADGKGKWWEGLDPRELYAQNHLPSLDFTDPHKIIEQWDWKHGASIPDQAYCDKFYNRVVDLINKYQPDLIYFDDNVLPLWPFSDAGLKIAAHFYNNNMAYHHGNLEAALFGKALDPEQRKCMVWDIERGTSNQIEPVSFSTDTCLGNWHYDRKLFEKHGYKSAKTVVQTLVDVVSKNGNLLLNVPLRGDGTLDADELAVVEGITSWMDVNREAIFDTRPWKICGEGPALESPVPLRAQGFNEGKGKPLTASDIRFTSKGNILYAIALGCPPDNKLVIKSLGTGSKLMERPINDLHLLASKDQVRWTQDESALTVWLPVSIAPTEANTAALVCKIILGQ